MKWLTNCGKDMYNPRDFGVQTVVGRPQSTEKYTTKQLESQGIIGIYEVDA